MRESLKKAKTSRHIAFYESSRTWDKKIKKWRKKKWVREEYVLELKAKLDRVSAQMERDYKTGMAVLKEHCEEVMVRVMKSRSQGKGNFAYIEGRDFKREERLAKVLQHQLWKMYSLLHGKEDEKGCCDTSCFNCRHMRYVFHSTKAPAHWFNTEREGWCCQEECECK